MHSAGNERLLEAGQRTAPRAADRRPETNYEMRPLHSTILTKLVQLNAKGGGQEV